MRYLYLLIFFLNITLQIRAQESVIQQKITLNSSETYVGEIVVKTDEMVMIKTSAGKRYQFQLSEVKKIEKVSNIDLSNQTEKSQIPEADKTAIFCGDIELSLGISSAVNSFKSAPNTEISMIFGNKNISEKDVFVGIGTGYNVCFLPYTSEPLSFLPVFLRLQNTLQKARTAPFISIDAGYCFGITSGFGGGPTLKVSVGIAHKTGYKSDIYTGVFAGLTSIYTRLKETNNLGTFNYTGNTSMTNLGFKFGFHF